MSSLKDRVCEVCHAGAELLRPDDRKAFAEEIPNWACVIIEDIEQLQREFTFEDYKSALSFTNAVADLAEKEGHHPALLLEWGKVTVRWWTHKIKGLHKNDLILAAKTDALLE